MVHDARTEPTAYTRMTSGIRLRLVHPSAARTALVGQASACPNTSTHLGWMLAGTVRVEHMAQMLGEMSCTQRAWCDFVSYDPRLPEHLQLFVRRFVRDPKLIAVLEREVEHFNAEIDGQIAALPEKPQGVVLSMDQIAEDEVQF